MSWQQALVDNYHADQRAIARRVVSELAPLWNLLDPHDLKGTTAQWLKAVRPVIERGILLSQYVAGEFYQRYRTAHHPEAEPLGIDFPDPLGVFTDKVIPDRDTRLRIMVAQKVTGPVWVAKHSLPDMTPDDINELMYKGFSKSTGSAIRMVMNSARHTMALLVESDPLAKGYARIAGQTACGDCKAKEGVYLKTDSDRKFDWGSVGHDFCRCVIVPIFGEISTESDN